MLAWLPKGSEILHDIERGSFVGLSLHMKDDLEPSKLMKTAHKPKCLCTIDLVLESMVEIALLEEVASKKNLPSSLPGAGRHFEWVEEQNTHNTTREKRGRRRRRRRSAQI